MHHNRYFSTSFVLNFGWEYLKSTQQNNMWINFMTYLWCADFIECNEDKGVEKATEGQVVIVTEGRNEEQRDLREEHKKTQQVGVGVALRQVQKVKIYWEVVSCVPSSDVVKVGLFEELHAVSVVWENKKIYICYLYNGNKIIITIKITIMETSIREDVWCSYWNRAQALVLSDHSQAWFGICE